MDFKNNDEKKTFIIEWLSFWYKKICNSKLAFYILLSFAVLFIVGIFICLFFQDTKSVNKILISRESMLNAKLTRLENVNDMLEAEILLLKNEVKSLSRKKDKKKLSKISKYLADTEVSGHGISIVLRDAGSNFLSVENSDAVIHNTDLLKIVNFLWAKNATAISINGERIVPNTYISCVGPTIIINQKRINSPFFIEAKIEKINLDEMKNDVFMLSLKYRGIEFVINEKDNIIIPAGKYVTFME